MASVQQAVTVLQLLAINEHLKSVCISGSIGSGKTELLSLYGQLSERPQAVIPTHVTVDRLFGGISIDETLQQQKIVYEESIFERADNGCFLVEHLERFEPMLARTIVKAVEEQAIQFTRDEVIEKRLSHTALYTIQAPYEQLPNVLLDCIGLSVTLDAPLMEHRISVLKNNPIANIVQLKRQVKEAKTRLPYVNITDDMLLYSANLLSQYGLHSMRAYYALIQAARAFAALQHELVITDDHIQAVILYVINHRTDAQPPQAEAPPQSSERQASSPEQQQEQAEDVLVDVEAKEQGTMSFNVEHMSRTKKRLSGKAAQLLVNKKHGRQIGLMPYKKATPDIDILATLKKAIPEQPLYEKGETTITVKPHHFVNKKRQQKQAQHFIFLVDASQSMHQNEQMTVVKGVVLSLLKDAYQKRNVISFISMYKEKSEIQLHASKNTSLARQTLQNLKVGGKTPLASGLELGLSIIQGSDIPIDATKLIVITDGRANMTLAGEKNVKQALQESLEKARELRQLGAQALVVDTEQGAVKLQKSKQLADELQGHYVLFSQFSKIKTYQFIRNGG